MISREPNPLFVTVLGAHRSGTSVCSHVLTALGIDMADDPTPKPSNPKGHWERWELVEFHDRILRMFNRAYLTPLHDLSMPQGWSTDPRVGDIKSEIISFLDRRMVSGVPFGFKDPRTARLLRLWQEIFNELDRQVKIVVCLRNPAEVARSLNERDGLPLDMGEYRWFRYMVDIFSHFHKDYICTIEYEAWFGDVDYNIKQLAQFLGLDLATLSDATVAIREIIDPRLRHDDSSSRSAQQPLIHNFYETVRRLNTEVAAPIRLAHTIHQFNQFLDLQQTYDLEVEQLSRATGALELLACNDGEAPITSWRDPRIPVAWNRLAAAPCRDVNALQEVAAGNLSTTASAQSIVRSLGDFPQRPMFFRYNPISEDGQALILRYRSGDLGRKTEAVRTFQAFLRWFDSYGRVLVWQTSPVLLDGSESDDWREASVSVPLFPRRVRWVRFELLASCQPQRMPLCTGFLLTKSTVIPQPDVGSPIMAYTHAPPPPALFLDGRPYRGTPASANDTSASLALIIGPNPIYIDTNILQEAEILIFVDCDCFGRRLVTARLPPPVLRTGARLMVPTGSLGVRVFAFRQASGTTQIV